MVRALILGGGGVKGSFSVGVLKHLLGDLGKQYDLIVGVSSGAINASFISQYPIGQEKLAIDTLSSMWLSLNNNIIYKKWKPFGKLHVAWKLGFFDSSPMKSLLQNSISVQKIRDANR